jgi:phosphoketolase
MRTIETVIDDKKPTRIVPALRATGAHAKEKFRVMQLECQAYAYENGIDKPEDDSWTWPSNA